MKCNWTLTNATVILKSANLETLFQHVFGLCWFNVWCSIPWFQCLDNHPACSQSNSMTTSYSVSCFAVFSWHLRIQYVIEVIILCQLIMLYRTLICATPESKWWSLTLSSQPPGPVTNSHECGTRLWPSRTTSANAWHCLVHTKNFCVTPTWFTAVWYT